MKKSTYKLISCIIGAVFVIALLIFVVNIITDKNNGIEQAEAKFKTLEKATSAACLKYEPTLNNNSNFAREFLKGINNISDFSEITLTLNNQTLYHYPPVENISVDPEVINTYNSQFITLYGNNLNLTASIYKINPSLVYYRARLPFMLILAGTVIAIILLVITGINNEKPAVELNLEDSEYDSDDDNVESEEINENENSNESVQEIESQEISETEDTIPEDDLDLSEVTYPQETEFTEPEIFGNNNEIISSETLTETLDRELVDAASTEQDITLLIIKINQLNKETDISNTIKEEIKSKYFQQGIVYDYNDDCFAVIIKNAGLDSVMTTAEELREKLLQVLSENEVSTEVTMGISSRSIRMINAERLITEADQAQQHSDADSPIIAFRVNPEKYRQFILNN